MENFNDAQLLRAYAERRSEPAFAELVRRHVDFVYSAALRMVCDSHHAQDVAQGVFVALAQNARQLSSHPVLSGWLHRTTQNLAANIVRTNVRRTARELEAVAMNELVATETDAPWENIAPYLDAALGDLEETDRDALLLRYFERKTAQEMAEPLGISAEAAQKRVSRAVERLRSVFAKRGVTVGATGLVIVISANAVQAAPAGLAGTISSAAALGGAVAHTTTATTAAKIIAMTTLQKTLVAAGLAVALTAVTGVTIHEVSAHRASATHVFSSTNTVELKWGETAVTGGWKLPGGQRAFMFTTLRHGKAPTSLNFSIQFVEVEGNNPLAPGGTNLLNGTLASDQLDVVLKQLTSRGATLMSQMQVETKSDGPAEITMQTDPQTLVSMGISPTLADDGQSVSLVLKPSMKYPSTRRPR